MMMMLKIHEKCIMLEIRMNEWMNGKNTTETRKKIENLREGQTQTTYNFKMLINKIYILFQFQFGSLVFVFILIPSLKSQVTRRGEAIRWVALRSMPPSSWAKHNRQ